ncbi:MAG: helix-turn-helix transcriptional regulator [Lachnospiraceae bacterium]|nr:helix-turn-helix transcriptional regulator [Lachnospiraceae bacterium]
MLGEYLSNYMKQKGIKQAFVSEKTGITQQKLGMILKDKQKITAQEYFKICVAVGIDPIKPVQDTGIYTIKSDNEGVTNAIA